MNRKGFLFTLFLLLFFSAILLSLFAYVHWFDRFSADSTHALSSASSLAYLFDDLTQDVLELQGISSLTVNHSLGNVTVSFVGGFNSSVNYTTLFQSYSTFIRGNYSQSVQYPLSLDSASYGFALPLYGVSTSQGTGSLYIFTRNSSLLKQINITLVVSNTSAFVSNSSPVVGVLGTLVHVRMLDPSGRELLNAEKLLSPSIINTPFRTTFNSNALLCSPVVLPGCNTVDVYYQTDTGRDGTLLFDYDQNITLLSLDLVYTDLNRTLFITTNTSITLQGVGLSQTKALGIEG